jgi:hypothetical protein
MGRCGHVAARDKRFAQKRTNLTHRVDSRGLHRLRAYTTPDQETIVAAQSPPCFPVGQ